MRKKLSDDLWADSVLWQLLNDLKSIEKAIKNRDVEIIGASCMSRSETVATSMVNICVSKSDIIEFELRVTGKREIK